MNVPYVVIKTRSFSCPISDHVMHGNLENHCFQILKYFPVYMDKYFKEMRNRSTANITWSEMVNQTNQPCLQKSSSLYIISFIPEARSGILTTISLGPFFLFCCLCMIHDGLFTRVDPTRANESGSR